MPEVLESCNRKQRFLLHHCNIDSKDVYVCYTDAGLYSVQRSRTLCLPNSHGEYFIKPGHLAE